MGRILCAVLLTLALTAVVCPAQETAAGPLGSRSSDYRTLLKNLVDKDITVLTLDGQAVRGRVARMDSVSLFIGSAEDNRRIPFNQIKKINWPGAGESQGAQAGNLVLIIAAALLGTALFLRIAT
ncbi:hypothetical protein LLH00_17675 [bacterium]|nr:hypothetical protein [bacterium]